MPSGGAIFLATHIREVLQYRVSRIVSLRELERPQLQRQISGLQEVLLQQLLIITELFMTVIVSLLLEQVQLEPTESM